MQSGETVVPIREIYANVIITDNNVIRMRHLYFKRIFQIFHFSYLFIYFILRYNIFYIYYKYRHIVIIL